MGVLVQFVKEIGSQKGLEEHFHIVDVSSKNVGFMFDIGGKKGLKYPICLYFSLSFFLMNSLSLSLFIYGLSFIFFFFIYGFGS